MTLKRHINTVRYGRTVGAMTHFIPNDNNLDLTPIMLWDHYQEQHLLHPTGLDFHGHSGIESLTYPILGEMHHTHGHFSSIPENDQNHTFVRHQHKLNSGDLLILTTGAGIVHKDKLIPRHGEVECFSLWRALPCGVSELQPPQYQVHTATQCPLIENNQSTTKVLVGDYQEQSSPAYCQQPLTFLDIHIMAYCRWRYPQQAQPTTGFLYVQSGSVYIEGRQVLSHQIATFSVSPEAIDLQVGSHCTRVLLILTQPQHRPIVRTEASVHSSDRFLTQGQQCISQLLPHFKSDHS